jgi:hypothetical protein
MQRPELAQRQRDKHQHQHWLNLQQLQLLEIHRMRANLGPRLHADVHWSFQREYVQLQQLHQGLIQQLDQRLLNHECRRFQRVTKSPPPAEIATE